MRSLSLLHNDFWSPLKGFGEVQNELDRAWPSRAFESSFLPACDVEEHDGQYSISIDLPGIKKEDVKIEINDYRITVSGERRYENKGGTKNKQFIERSYGKFERSFSLPATVEVDKIAAKFEDGILTLSLPKVEASKPRQIKVG